MEWPTIAQISTLAPLPEGYHYEKLSAADVLPSVSTDLAILVLGGLAAFLGAWVAFWRYDVR